MFTSNDLVQQTVFTLHQFLGQVSIVYSYIGYIGSDTLHEEGEEREEDTEEEKEDEKDEVGEEGRHSRCLMCQYSTVTCPTLVH